MSKEVEKSEKKNDCKIGFLTKISFAVFLVGLLSLLAGWVYSIRFEIVKDLNDSYLSIMNAPLSDKIAAILGIITLTSLIIFLLSIPTGGNEGGNENENE